MRGSFYFLHMEAIIINSFITIVVAVKNEEQYIEKCLQSLINQDFPNELYQIVVVDGMSTDQTMNIVKEYREKYPDLIKIYRNPKEWQAVGRNIAIRNEKKSDLIAYIDGHCVADKRWLSTLYDSLQVQSETKVAGVGSVHVSPEDDPLTGKAIEQVFSTIVGGIGSSFRVAKEKKEVTTVPFVLYKKEALEKVGLYDEDMKYGEDFTLNYKLMKAGYKLLVDPKAIVYYYKRGTILSFSIQMYNYGITKAIIGKKYSSSLKVSHYIPSIAVIFLVMFGILGIYVIEFILLLYLMIFLYIVVIISSSLISAFKKNQWLFTGLMPILYIIEHFAYSIGFLRGLFKKGWKR